MTTRTVFDEQISHMRMGGRLAGVSMAIVVLTLTLLVVLGSLH